MAHHSSSHKPLSSAAKVCQDLATLINNRQDSDIQFKVGDGISTIQENEQTIYKNSTTTTLYAHSLILRCRSRYFAAMLDKDKNWKESSNGIIYKPNISSNTFEDILHYIYTGNARVKNSDNIIELITAADEMELEELSAECQDELIRTVDHIFSHKDESEKTFDGLIKQPISIDVAIRTYIIPALNFASNHSLPHLSQRIQAVMLPRMSVIINSPDAYVTFVNGISFEPLAEIIASDNLVMKERNVWDLVLSWGCHQTNLSKVAVETQLSNPEDREDEGESSTGTAISVVQLDQLKTKIAPLLPAIRFSLLYSDDYYQIFAIINYFLPSRRSFELNRFFLKPNSVRSLDIPRNAEMSLDYHWPAFNTGSLLKKESKESRLHLGKSLISINASHGWRSRARR